MAELYTILDDNEIDGQDKDNEVYEIDTAVLTHTDQELPAGNYDFAYSYQVTSDTGNKDFDMSLLGSVVLVPMTVHLAKSGAGAYRDTYFFNLSWDGGLFNLQMVMKKADTSFSLMCDFAEFSVKRRS